MATTTLIPLHAGKGKTVAAAIGRTTNYVKNPDKTDGGEWVSAYECDPLTVDAEFLFSKRQYAMITGRENTNDVIGYHLRQAFKPGEIDAATANKIGYELALRLTHGKNAFICCTHTNTQSIHNHIIINSVTLDCSRKFRNFKNSSFAIRKISDMLCAENGLSIIEKPKPSRGSYGSWLGDKKPTGRDKLRDIIDENIVVGRSLTEFFSALKRAGVELKNGKQISFKPPGSKKFFRQDSLGADYTIGTITERLAGKRIVETRKTSDDTNRKAAEYAASQNRPSLLIDIQAKIAEGKGAGYAQWAKIFNLKEAARTLVYLKEIGIDSYDELKKKSSFASGDFLKVTKRIKEIETRQKEISELQKQIGTYGKTREVYAQYKASGWDSGFYESYRADIILHKAAKKYFDGIGMKKLPKIDQLKQEYAKLNSEKKALYGEYHKLKISSRELATATYNVERILGVTTTQNRDTRDRDAR